MAFIGILVPPSISNSLSTIQVPGDPTPIGEMHITMIYLGKGLSLSSILKVIAACRIFAQKTQPFWVGTALVTSFPINEDGIPIITKIVSPRIQEVHSKLLEVFQKLNIPFNNKYPDYTPHVTLSYSKEEISDFNIDPLKWTVDSLHVWGDDHGEGKISAKIELGAE